MEHRRISDLEFCVESERGVVRGYRLFLCGGEEMWDSRYPWVLYVLFVFHVELVGSRG